MNLSILDRVQAPWLNSRDVWCGRSFSIHVRFGFRCELKAVERFGRLVTCNSLASLRTRCCDRLCTFQNGLANNSATLAQESLSHTRAETDPEDLAVIAHLLAILTLQVSRGVPRLHDPHAFHNAAQHCPNPSCLASCNSSSRPSSPSICSAETSLWHPGENFIQSISEQGSRAPSIQCLSQFP